MYFTEKQMVSLYLIGGFAGALFYVVAYNVFPYFEPYVQLSDGRLGVVHCHDNWLWLFNRLIWS